MLFALRHNIYGIFDYLFIMYNTDHVYSLHYVGIQIAIYT